MDFPEAVFRCDDEGLGQVIAGHNTAVFLCPGQKFPCALGGGCVVHMENAHNRVRPHGHIVANVQIHNISFRRGGFSIRPMICIKTIHFPTNWICINIHPYSLIISFVSYQMIVKRPLPYLQLRIFLSNLFCNTCFEQCQQITNTSTAIL